PKLRELYSIRESIEKYLLNNKDNVLAKARELEGYLNNIIAELKDMKKYVEEASPQTFSLADIHDYKKKIDYYLSLTVQLVISNETYFYWYKNLSDAIESSEKILYSKVWAEIERIVGFKLILSKEDIALIKNTTLPAIDSSISYMEEALKNIYEIERNYNSFVKTVLSVLDKEIDRISLHFVGLQNFLTLFGDSRFPYSIFKTMLFVLTSVPLKIGVGVLLAFFFSTPLIYGRKIMRAMLLIPWAIPILLSVTTWRMLFTPGMGPFAEFIKSVTGVEFNIFGKEWDAFIVYNIVELWLAYPFVMTVTMGAISGIPRELIEAAYVDGASVITRFRKIMLPLTLRPIMFATILTTGASLQAFMVPLLINGGGPTKEISFLWFSKALGNVNEMMVLFGYNRAWIEQKYGLSAASYLIVVIILFIYALLWFKLVYKRQARWR
ncbi:MAG: sugar ABC transporter permease, partial [Thermoprotei archaeon]